MQGRLRKPFRDKAAVNATGWRLCEALVRAGQPAEVSSDWRTKWNCHRLGVP